MRISFGEFTLDRETRELRRGATALHLEPKAYELLDLLLARRPAAVSKSDIQAELWPDTFVTEGSVTGLVTQIRQALGDDRARSRFVRTVHGFGYAFCGETRPASPAGRRTRGPRHHVVWQQQVIRLEPGENVLGRGDDVSVPVTAPGVSRHHARILLEGDEATLEDLGSKNGTWLDEERLSAPARLRDGDVFRLGRERLVFRRAPSDGSTATERSRG
jgi:DNA-binding winged helix-turn-helix (wHTH) protein